MAKKRKTAKRRKPKTHMMVIRVAVPARLVPALKVMRVLGLIPGRYFPHELEVLSAYYDMRGQPNART